MVAVDKRQDWEIRFARFVEERLRMPFTWGLNDCCLFACDGIRAMYDVDVAADFRGRYDTAEGALRLVRDYTGGGGVAELADMLTDRWRLSTVEWAYARRSDLVLFNGSVGLTLGLVDFNGKRILAPAVKGLGAWPLKDAQRVWRLDTAWRPD